MDVKPKQVLSSMAASPATIVPTLSLPIKVNLKSVNVSSKNVPESGLTRKESPSKAVNKIVKKTNVTKTAKSYAPIKESVMKEYTKSTKRTNSIIN